MLVNSILIRKYAISWPPSPCFTSSIVEATSQERHWLQPPVGKDEGCCVRPVEPAAESGP